MSSTVDTGFERRGGVLCVEGVPLAEIAARFGTPAYVYSGAVLRHNVAALRAGLGSQAHRLCYAIKANGNLAILELLAEAGCDFDAVSLGELARALAAGVSGERVIQSGVGKRDDEIAAALAAGVLYLAVESEEELHAVARVARERHTRAPVSLRVNPEIDARTHPHVATGLAESKFGVPLAQVTELVRAARAEPSLDLCGVSCHIGSQITDLAPFRDAGARTATLAAELVRAGVPLRYVGLGGGLGIRYTDEKPPEPEEYGRVVREAVSGLGLTLVLEPGRAIVGSAGGLLTRVVRVKEGGARRFLLIDAGMNDLVRPALYGARHRIEPLADAPAVGPADVVGPVCETADTFARGISLPRLEAGALLVLRDTGAYGFAMSSTYNSRPRAAEVLVDGGRVTLVRERERLAELWRGERRRDGSPAPTVLPAPLEENDHGEDAT